MATIVQCSACQRRLQVPDELIGKAVKCPKCGGQFIAEASESGETSAEVGIRTDRSPLVPGSTSPPPEKKMSRDDERETTRGRRQRDDDEEEIDDDRPRRRRKRRSLARPVTGLVLAPAICLAISGVLAVLANGAQVVLAFAFPDFLANNNPFGAGAVAPPWISGVSGLAFMMLGFGTIAGSVAMMKSRLWGLALVGAILAMINIGNGCCIFGLGLPFGIWAIVILVRPEVKDAFTS